MSEVSATAISASGLRAQGVRLRHISENIANADTPGYRRKLVSFEPDRDFGRDTGTVRASRIHDAQRYEIIHPTPETKRRICGEPLNDRQRGPMTDTGERFRRRRAHRRVGMFDQAQQKIRHFTPGIRAQRKNRQRAMVGVRIRGFAQQIV